MTPLSTTFPLSNPALKSLEAAHRTAAGKLASTWMPTNTYSMAMWLLTRYAGSVVHGPRGTFLELMILIQSTTPDLFLVQSHSVLTPWGECGATSMTTPTCTFSAETPKTAASWFHYYQLHTENWTQLYQWLLTSKLAQKNYTEWLMCITCTVSIYNNNQFWCSHYDLSKY